MTKSGLIICNRVNRTDNNRCINCGAKSGHDCQMKPNESDLLQMEEELLKAAIKGILNEYGCLHSGGKLWDEVTEEIRNEELVTRLLMLHKNKDIRFRTVIYLYKEDFDGGIRFIEDLILFKRDDFMTIEGKNYVVQYTDYNFDNSIYCVYVTEDH